MWNSALSLLLERSRKVSTLLLNHITLLCIKTGVFRVCFRTPDITTQYSQMHLDPESL